jgi:hypothetical protein
MSSGGSAYNLAQFCKTISRNKNFWQNELKFTNVLKVSVCSTCSIQAAFTGAPLNFPPCRSFPDYPS